MASFCILATLGIVRDIEISFQTLKETYVITGAFFSEKNIWEANDFIKRLDLLFIWPPCCLEETN